MISSDHLEPGQKGKIMATVDTAGKAGRIEKFITVYSNDPHSPAMTLSLSLEIVQQ